MKNIFINFYFIFLVGISLSRYLDVTFESEDDWIMGVSWVEGSTFYNGINVGSPILYGESTVGEMDVVDVDLRFSQSPDSVSTAIVYSNQMDGVELGLGTFPGSAWDISNPDNPRRLNVCFFEDPDGDRVWNPTSLLGSEKEYLIIMLSSYDDSGQAYNNQDAINMDVQYFSWLKRKPGEDWFSSVPAVLKFRNFFEFNRFNIFSSDNTLHLEWSTELDSSDISFSVYRSEDGNYFNQIAQNIDQGYYIDDNLHNQVFYSYYIEAYNYADSLVMTSAVKENFPFPVSSNTSLINHWNEGNLYSDLNPKYNDIWGYTDIEGNEFAAIGTWDGTHIVDLQSNQETGFIPGSFSSHRDIKSFGNYIYIGTEANWSDPFSSEYSIESQGIQVVDMSDPFNPLLVNEWDGVVNSHNIMEHQGYLYVIGSTRETGSDGGESWGLDDLIVLDLNDPSSPQKVGGWSGDYLHDVCMYQDILFGCGISSDVLHVFDISDKTNPVQISSIENIPSIHACWVSEDGNTLFTASETSGGHVMSWNVSDVQNINLLDLWYPEGGENWSAHNVFVKGNYLFISYYVYGLQVLDVTNPENMLVSGFYDTYNQYVPGAIFNGAWGAFPYLSNNKIAISDRSSGLFLVDFYPDDLVEVLGDINQDGFCDVLDVVLVVSVVMGQTSPNQYEFIASDLNLDDVIDILDIISLVNIIVQ